MLFKNNYQLINQFQLDFKINKLLLFVVFLTGVVFSAQAIEVTPAQQQVLDHYTAMKDMNSQERKAYREQMFSGMNKAQQKDYQKAFKQIRGMLPEYLGVERNNQGKITKQKATGNKVNRVPGTNITYDTGTSSGTAGLASQMLGNRFDTGWDGANIQNVETSGSVTQITFDMVNTFFSSAVWSLYSNVMGTTAVQVTSMGRGVMTGLNTLGVGTPTTANVYANGTFLAGIFQFMPASTGLAVDNTSANGQGFHAISLNDGTTGSMLTTVTTGMGGGGRNAIFRVSGDVLDDSVPVELIDFTIDKDEG